jgi:hypothetical protein
MATTAEMTELFGRINAATSNIAADINALLNRPEVPDSVREEALVLTAQLEQVASAYTPVPPVPGEVPGAEPLPA